MAFELVVDMKTGVKDLRRRWQEELRSYGFSVEIFPSFAPDTWSGGFLPIKLIAMPDKYLFGLSRLVQITGFEVSFGPESAHFRSAMGRTLAELILLCYGAASLAVITDGVYHDPQTGESFEGADAVARADWEIRQYEPYIDEDARTQHRFTSWPDVA